MNPKRNTTVTRGPWNCGGMSGSGIEGYILQPFRMREGFQPTETCHMTVRFQKGQLHGYSVTGTYDERRAEAQRLELLYGYAQYYGRNTCGFVMSRAARKRGYKTTDGMYNRAVARNGK